MAFGSGGRNTQVFFKDTELERPPAKNALLIISSVHTLKCETDPNTCMLYRAKHLHFTQC